MTRDEARAKICVALDVNDVDKARALRDVLKGKVGGFKIGFEFMYSLLVTLLTTDYGAAHDTLEKARMFFGSLKSLLFFDCKIADIPNTVAGAARAITEFKPLMFNMHAFAGGSAIAAARTALDETSSRLRLKTKPLLFVVTLLTSLDEVDLQELGLKPENLDNTNKFRLKLVVRYATLAKAKGADGVIASPLEIEAIREACGPNFLIYTPGIRMPTSSTGDQKAVGTPGFAIAKGADGLVIGRDITASDDPAAAVEKIIDNMLQETAA